MPHKAALSERYAKIKVPGLGLAGGFELGEPHPMKQLFFKHLFSKTLFFGFSTLAYISHWEALGVFLVTLQVLFLFVVVYFGEIIWERCKQHKPK